MASESEPSANEAVAQTIEMPASTGWPIMLALGITLILAGIVTNFTVSVVGAALAVAAGIGWASLLVTETGMEHERLTAAEAQPRPVTAVPGMVETLAPGMPGHRMQLPEQIHPYSAGAKGGLVGALAMAGPALLYGVFSRHHSIWWPVNLLAGMVLPQYADMSVQQLEAYHALGLVVGIAIHLAVSVGAGLLYGVLLPTLPQQLFSRRGGYLAPLFWGGVVAPLLWTGCIYGFMSVLNPALRQHVNWFWFVVSQFAYGVTVGVVVTRSEKVHVGT